MTKYEAEQALRDYAELVRKHREECMQIAHYQDLCREAKELTRLMARALGKPYSEWVDFWVERYDQLIVEREDVK